MPTTDALKLRFELIWWLITALVVFAVLFPIYKAMYVWPFRNWNILFIISLITMARYTFLLRHTFLARRQVAKVAVILILFPLTFALVNGLNIFLNYIEENTWDTLTGHLPTAQKKAIESYMWAEMIFFGVGSILAAPALAIRSFLSIWRQHNRGTV